MRETGKASIARAGLYLERQADSLARYTWEQLDSPRSLSVAALVAG